MTDRAASVLAQRLVKFAPDMFDFLLSVLECDLDGESGSFVLSRSQMNELHAIVFKAVSDLDLNNFG